MTDAEKTKWNNAVTISNFSNNNSNGGIQIGSFILKWGKTWCTKNNNTSVVFSSSFKNACLGATVTMETSDDTDSEIVGVNTITASSMRLMNGEGRDRYLIWFAWGW